jgi:CheY-like chemotaxis protein
MVIELLLITRDAELLKTMRSALEPFGAVLHVRSDTETALEIATRRHFGGLVIDCDDLPEGNALLSRLREQPSTRSSTLIAVENGLTSLETAVRLGANFVLEKPVSFEYAQRVLQTAMVPITQNCRRYFRHKVEVPATITTISGSRCSVRMINISEGGLAVEFTCPQPLDGVVGISFDLPSIDGFTIEVKAEVVWTDLRRAGMRFISMSPETQQKLHAWLKALYGKERLLIEASAGSAAV